MPYIYNIPYSYGNLYRKNIKNNYYSPNNNRIGFGGFILPFALGFASAPLVLNNPRPNYYPYYPNTSYNYYNPYYYNNFNNPYY